MKQAKFEVIQVIDYGLECLCQATIEGKTIAVQANTNDFTVSIGTTVLVEYNSYLNHMTGINTVYTGKIIAICKNWNPAPPESLNINGISMPEEKEMNNHVVELMLENFYTVGIQFKNSHKVYTYKVALGTELEEEDQIVVQTTSGFEIVTVARVDEGMNIDLSSDIKYKFIVQKLDLTQYQEMQDKDKNVASVIAQNQAQEQKEKLLAQYTDHLSEEQVKLLEDCGVKAITKL